MTDSILCVGELLWDELPTGLSLGGAPFNVACHLRAAGQDVRMVSRVGHDELGVRAIDGVTRHGVGPELIQVDGTLPTGTVHVSFDVAGNPQYDIAAPAAWDAIQWTPALLEAGSVAEVLVFGSLAQRSAITRATITHLLDSPALKVFDVNLRTPFDDAKILQRSLERADVVKLNHEELQQIISWFGLPPGLEGGMSALARKFDCRLVCVTRGRNGAAMWRDGTLSEHPGFRVEVADTVGTGDAFLAAVVSALLGGHDDDTILTEANLLGAYVATQIGPIPAYDRDAIARIRASAG